MADDGMLLNFSIPDSGIIAKPTFKGGNWKSRLTAKKAAQNWHTKATARLNGEAVPKKTVENATNVNRIELGPRKARVSKSPEFHDSGDRPVKRARVSGDFRPRTTEKTDNADFRTQTPPRDQVNSRVRPRVESRSFPRCLPTIQHPRRSQKRTNAAKTMRLSNLQTPHSAASWTPLHPSACPRRLRRTC